MLARMLDAVTFVSAILFGVPMLLIQLRHGATGSALRKDVQGALGSDLDRTDGVLLAIAGASFLVFLGALLVRVGALP